MDTRLLAKKIRIHTLRMTSQGGTAHIGSIFSMADLLAVLYGNKMKIDPKKPDWEERDRFILSKGHAGGGLYAVLAELGFFPISKLETHYQDGSDLSGHVTHKGNPGIEFSTGSLGHGLSVAVGMAYAAKQKGEKHKVYTVLSDGECDEGSVWEALMFAGHHKLDNLVTIIDYNKIQSLDFVSSTLALEPFADKFSNFGWATREVDGHDHNALQKIFDQLPFEPNEKPSCIIAHTIKGKGVSFMENTVLWHYRTAQGKEYDAALKELEEHS